MRSRPEAQFAHPYLDAVGRFRSFMSDAFSLRVTGLVAALLVLIWIGLGLDFLRLQKLHFENAKVHALGLAQAMDERVMRTVSTVDVVLQSIEERIRFRASRGEVAVIEEILHGIDPLVEEVVTISFNNAAGIGVVNSNRAVATGKSYANAEFFRVHVDNPDYGAFIGGPFVGPASGKRVFVISRRVSSAHGDLLGTLVASVSTDVLAAKFEAERIGQQGLIGLYHIPTQKTVVRQPDYVATFGKVLTAGRIFGELARAPTGTFEADSIFDSEKRLFVYRRLASTPLVLAVGISLTEINARLKDDLSGFLIVLCILSLAVAGAAAGILVGHHRQMAVKEALDSTKNRYMALSGVSTVGVYHADRDGNLLYVNEQWSRVAGLGLDKALGKGWMQALHPDDGARVREDWEQARTTHTPFACEFRFLRADGEVRWVLGQAREELDREGKVSGYVGTVTDLTQLKLAEQELRIAAAAFESQEAMMITDANSVIIKVNQAFTEITGYSAEEVIGQTPRLLQSGRHNAAFYSRMWDSIMRTGGWQGEVWDRRKNGEEYPKWLTISALKDSDGVVTHYIGAHYDITERKQSEDKIHELAFYDQLTGLPNRTLLLDRLRRAMTSSSRNGTYGVLLFLDLDKFKSLNDTLGHHKGDMLLKQVAQRLTTCIREEDTVARLGGDEFVVMLAGLSLNEADAATQAEAVGEKILGALNKIYQLDDVAHHSSVSIGATLFRGHLATVVDLLKQADLAMYKAKDAGRNTLRFFDPGMETIVMQRVTMEDDLRKAIQEEQFVLHYQAQLVGGQVKGAEVLVRWQHPKRGLVSPAEFIPLAEESGLILPLGYWVLETACTQLALWATHEKLAHLTVAVNVSAHQFRQPDFVAQVLARLRAAGANPQRLKLELTESLLVANVEDIIEKMFALKAQGVSFSLDDFGTGYSSLSYLKRLPLDQLKIDQSFVRDVLSDPNDASIAKTIIALAEGLGLGVIAEGVETGAQVDFLANAGCLAYQGYFFSRPLAVNAFEDFAQIMVCPA